MVIYIIIIILMLSNENMLKRSSCLEENMEYFWMKIESESSRCDVTEVCMSLCFVLICVLAIAGGAGEE